MRRVFISAAIALACLPVATGATSLADGFDGFRSVLQDRIDAISGIGSPTAEETAESAALQKILDASQAYTGGSDKSSLSLAAKLAGATFKATQGSLAGGTAVTPLLGAIVDLVQSARTEAGTQRDKLSSQANRDKVQAAMDKAQASFDLGEAQSDWGRAAKYLLKALAGFDKAVSAALKAQAKEASGPASIVCQWTGVNFVGDAKASTAVWNSGTGGFGVTAQMPGNPMYVLTLSATGVFAPATFGLSGGSGGVTAIQGMVPQNMWLITSGSLTVTTLTSSRAVGTFSFNALSGSTGAISVINGAFNLPVAQ